jgi:hypothetical protein
VIGEPPGGGGVTRCDDTRAPPPSPPPLFPVLLARRAPRAASRGGRGARAPPARPGRPRQCSSAARRRPGLRGRGVPLPPRGPRAAPASILNPPARPRRPLGRPGAAGPARPAYFPAPAAPRRPTPARAAHASCIAPTPQRPPPPPPPSPQKKPPQPKGRLGGTAPRPRGARAPLPPSVLQHCRASKPPTLLIPWARVGRRAGQRGYRSACTVEAGAPSGVPRLGEDVAPCRPWVHWAEAMGGPRLGGGGASINTGRGPPRGGPPVQRVGGAMGEAGGAADHCFSASAHWRRAGINRRVEGRGPQGRGLLLWWGHGGHWAAAAAPPPAGPGRGARRAGLGSRAAGAAALPGRGFPSRPARPPGVSGRGCGQCTVTGVVTGAFRGAAPARLWPQRAASAGAAAMKCVGGGGGGGGLGGGGPRSAPPHGSIVSKLVVLAHASAGTGRWQNGCHGADTEHHGGSAHSKCSAPPLPPGAHWSSGPDWSQPASK